MRRLTLTAAAALVAGMAVTNDERAAGLYSSDRGVRPLGRGGAFVAGADDLGAVWYNPAGRSDAGNTVLVDFAWLHFTSEYTRRTLAGGAVTEFPTVHGTTPFLPIPTI